MCGLTSQVLARDFKAGGHPDLISSAKLLQRFLALDFAVIYCHLLSFISRYSIYITHVYSALWAVNIFFARRRSGLCFSAKRYARDEHSALRQRLCVMMISDINISLPAHLTSIMPPYIYRAYLCNYIYYVYLITQIWILYINISAIVGTEHINWYWYLISLPIERS